MIYIENYFRFSKDVFRWGRGMKAKIMSEMRIIHQIMYVYDTYYTYWENQSYFGLIMKLIYVICVFRGDRIMSTVAVEILKKKRVGIYILRRFSLCFYCLMCGRRVIIYPPSPILTALLGYMEHRWCQNCNKHLFGEGRFKDECRRSAVLSFNDYRLITQAYQCSVWYFTKVERNI